MTCLKAKFKIFADALSSKRCNLYSTVYNVREKKKHDYTYTDTHTHTPYSLSRLSSRMFMHCASFDVRFLLSCRRTTYLL